MVELRKMADASYLDDVQDGEIANTCVQCGQTTSNSVMYGEAICDDCSGPGGLTMGRYKAQTCDVCGSPTDARACYGDVVCSDCRGGD